MGIATASAPVISSSPAAPKRHFEEAWAELERMHAWRISELSVDNREIARALCAYAWQDYDNRHAVKFREQHKLAELVAGAANDWEAILRLRHWVNVHMRDGNPSFSTARPSAILDGVTHGATFWCTFYGYAFAGACAAVGIPARHIGIDCEHEKGEGSTHHGIADVWSNHFRKWIAIDAHYHSHLELNGIPLNCEEIGMHWRKHRGEGLKSFSGPHHREVPRARPSRVDKHESCGYYWHYIDLHNDYHHHGKHTWPDPVVFPVDDERRKRIWYQGSAEKSHPHGRYANKSWFMTERAADAYPDLNCVKLELLPPMKPWNTRVNFHSMVPNYSHYLVKIDNADIDRTEGVSYTWRLHPGLNSLEVRAVNLAGWEGPASRVEIRIEDDKTRKPEWPSVPH
jgi:hypothetical protein